MQVSKPSFLFFLTPTDVAQALSTRELFEAGAEGAWSRELYHLPSSDHLQHRPVETRYHLHDEKVDVVNRCIDPRAICSEGSEDVGNSSEEEDDVPHLRLRTKGSARGHQDCHHKHHLCTSDDDDIPMLPLRPGAATARIVCSFCHGNP